MTAIVSPCPKCGQTLKKEVSYVSGLISLAGAVMWGISAYWDGAVSGFFAACCLCTSFVQLMKGDTCYACPQCKVRFPRSDVEKTPPKEG